MEWSRKSLGVLKRRWRWVAVVTVLGLVAGTCWSLATPRTYRAQTGVFFSLQFGDSAAALVQGSTYTQNQVTSYARLATTPAVLQPVITQLGLDTTPAALAGRVQAAAPLDTVIVEITATDATAAGSARLADAVASALSDRVEQLAPKTSSGQPAVRVTTVSPAQLPRAAATPDTPLDVAAGLLLGLLLGLVLAWGREVLDTRVRTTDDLVALTAAPLLGTIGAAPGSRRRGHGLGLVVQDDPHGPLAESFRRLRTNLQFLDVPRELDEEDRGPRVLAVTSSVAGEGKSTVATNLAIALAETGARVLLVDGDLRRPSVARMLGMEDAAGLTTVLLGRVSAADVVQEWGLHGLEVLPSGAIPPNPTELLGSPAMRRFLQQVRGAYDHVVLDTPPLLPVADGAVLSRAADGVVLVANATKVRGTQLAESLATLDQVGARTSGVVLNQVRRDEQTYDYGRTVPVPELPAARPSQLPPPRPPVGSGRPAR